MCDKSYINCLLFIYSKHLKHGYSFICANVLLKFSLIVSWHFSFLTGKSVNSTPELGCGRHVPKYTEILSFQYAKCFSVVRSKLMSVCLTETSDVIHRPDSEIRFPCKFFKYRYFRGIMRLDYSIHLRVETKYRQLSRKFNFIPKSEKMLLAIQLLIFL